MTSLSKRANNGAQGNNFLTGKNNKSKKAIPTPVVLLNNKEEKNKVEEPEIQDAVIVPDEPQKEELTPTPETAAPQAEAQKTTVAPAETTQTVVTEPKQPVSIEKLMEKGEKLYKHNEKYKEIQAKIKEVEDFEISHDDQNAQLTLVDALGRTIQTSNPLSIGQVLKDWKERLLLSLGEKEAEIRQLLAE